MPESAPQQTRARPPDPGLGGRGSHDALFVRLLAAGDMAVCAASVLAAYGLRVLLGTAGALPPLGPGHSLTTYLYTLPAVVTVWLISHESAGLYRPRRSISRFSEFLSILKAASLTVVILMALSFLRKYDYSRSLMTLFWLVSLHFAWGFRATMSDLRRRLLRAGTWGARAVIVGTGELGRMVLAHMRRLPEFGYDPIGFVDSQNDDPPPRVDDLPVLGTLSELPGILEAHRIAEAFVAEPSLRPGQMLGVIGACEDLPTVFRLVSGPWEALTSTMDIDGIADLPLVTLRNRPFRPWQRAVKRLMDLVLGAVFSVLALAPALVVALIIRLTSPGPAVFRQQRVGQNGIPFTVYKFRTMLQGPDGPEVTPIGHWLRRTSLDELPQLLNVLKGDMSLVGPRPELAEIVAGYEPWQRKRLEAKPGLTGLWQILGRKDLPLTENIQYDFYYLRNQSLLFDLAILLKTVTVVLRGQGAY